MAQGRLARAEVLRSFTGARTGASSSTAVGVPSPSQTAAQSGAGTTTAAGVPRVVAAGALVGAGVSSGAGRPDLIGSATAGGSGQSDASSVLVVFATAASMGDSRLKADVAALMLAADPDPLTGDGELTADALLSFWADGATDSEGTQESAASLAFEVSVGSDGRGDTSATGKFVVARNITITVGAPTGHALTIGHPTGNALTIGSPEAL